MERELLRIKGLGRRSRALERIFLGFRQPGGLWMEMCGRVLVLLLVSNGIAMLLFCADTERREDFKLTSHRPRYDLRIHEIFVRN